MTMLTVHDPDLLTAAVKAKGSYRSIASAAGVSHSFLAQLCSGRRSRVSVEFAVAVSGILGIQVSEAFTLPEAGALREAGLV